MTEQTETQVTLGVSLAHPDGSFRAPVRTVLEAAPLAADFNRDGLPDLATAAGIRFGNGDGTFQPARTLRRKPQENGPDLPSPPTSPATD